MRKLLSEMVLYLGKRPNQTTHESEIAGALPGVWNLFWLQFSHEVLYDYCSKKIDSFGQYLKKMDFPLCFQKRICLMLGVIFTSER